MPQTTFKDEGGPSMIPIRKSSLKDMSVPAIKPVRRVEFDEESIKATSPIRKVKPPDIEIPIRALHRSDSDETIKPSLVQMRRTPSKDNISPAMDGTHTVRRSTSRDRKKLKPSPVQMRRTPSKDNISPVMDGTHTVRRSTSRDRKKFVQTIRGMDRSSACMAALCLALGPFTVQSLGLRPQCLSETQDPRRTEYQLCSRPRRFNISNQENSKGLSLGVASIRTFPRFSAKSSSRFLSSAYGFLKSSPTGAT